MAANYEMVAKYEILGEGYTNGKLYGVKPKSIVSGTLLAKSEYSRQAPVISPIGAIPMGAIPWSYIKPELVGCTLGAIAALAIALYAFITGQTSAGVALLGPFLATIFGCLALIALAKKIK